MTALLEISDLTISARERTLVHGVSFELHAGEMLGVVGESGSGKSLTALSIQRLLAEELKTQGRISFDGIRMDTLPEHDLRAIRGKQIGMIFQEPMTALNPLHTIGAQLKEAITLHRSLKDATTSQLCDLLDSVGLSHLHSRLQAYPHELSGGERQRVMIAMAIANHPKLLIADEPTTAVDVTVQATILQLLKTLQRERGMAMLFITHDLHLVRRMADRVAVMKNGEIVETGTVEAVFSAPQHSYTKQLLASEPRGEAVAVAADATTLISAESLAVSYPIKRGVFKRVVGKKHALQPVSFELRAGETLGVIGESGSGKTTLAMALLRLAPFAGRVVMAGVDLAQADKSALKAMRKDMQLVFQDPFGSLNPRMTVGQIIAEGLQVHTRMTADEWRHAVTTILQEVGLTPDMAERYPHAFSGGQRQRISLARALILRPQLLILDEPTSALDITVQCQIVDLLREFQLTHGLSYIVISHDLRVIRALAHRVIVLKHGEVVEQGMMQHVFDAPTSDYTRTLMQSAYL